MYGMYTYIYETYENQPNVGKSAVNIQKIPHKAWCNH